MKLLIALMLYTGLAFGLERNAKIFVTSQTDMVGSAIVRQLKNRGYDNLLISSPNELDLLDQKAVLQFFEATKPNYVFLTSAKDRQLGSTYGNKTSPAEALSYNLSVQLNVIDAAYRSKVKKLLFISSPSIYPRICSKTIKEDDYLTGPIEPTLEWSGLAKIAGIKLCQAYNLQYGTRFISCVPANFYGPNDDYQEQYYPDLLALIDIMDEAKKTSQPSITIPGTGRANQEFTHIEDVADACIFLMKKYEGNQPVNIGWGRGPSIKELAISLVYYMTIFPHVDYDTSRPDGSPSRVLDSTLINSLGWYPKHTIDTNLFPLIQSYLKQKESL